MYPPLVSGGRGALACGRGGGGVQIRARGQTLWFSSMNVLHFVV
jgi:hypothetical protein